jgi:hypothetical protein
MKKFMKIVGGKRGLSVIATALITVAATTGLIPADLAVKLGAAATALGAAGIVHHNVRD